MSAVHLQFRSPREQTFATGARAGVLATLPHDAAEYVTGDSVTSLGRAVRMAFGLPALLSAEWAVAIDNRADHSSVQIEPHFVTDRQKL
ncbi:hypothetical protein MTBSS4_210012 [Magnetospirillum sp. SS-4]|nr:hypothetical protein MTBSS4_210012 [Magnetospirillum sp. SS-4]